MYTKTKPNKTDLKVNTSYEGETIENKINRIVNNKEPIKDGAPIIYTDRREGVQPEFDIRTDRFEIAVEATDIISKSHITKRQSFHNEKTENERLAEEAKSGIKKEESTQNTTTTTPEIKIKTEQKPNAGGESTQATS